MGQHCIICNFPCDEGKEKMPRIGSINLASLILDEIKNLDQ